MKYEEEEILDDDWDDSMDEPEDVKEIDGLRLDKETMERYLEIRKAHEKDRRLSSNESNFDN